MTTTGDVILLCDGNDSGYRPQGLPSGYSWYKGDAPPMDGNKACPAGWTSATSYFVLYPRDLVAEGKPNEPYVACNLLIKDTELYLHKVSGGWDRFQDASFAITVARMDGPQTGNNGYTLSCTKQSDGSYKVEAPPLNYCDHGWPAARASFPANKYDHAFTIMRFKLDNAQSDMVGMAGVDWWQSPSANYPNNMGTGVCSWVPIKSDVWTELYCTQMLVSKFEADPPPGVTVGAAGAGGGGGGGGGGQNTTLEVPANKLTQGSTLTIKVT